MRRQYQINHRTRNTRFDRQELITRLEDNRVSTTTADFVSRSSFILFFVFAETGGEGGTFSEYATSSAQDTSFSSGILGRADRDH
jgi:hypothetical protein